PSVCCGRSCTPLAGYREDLSVRPWFRSPARSVTGRSHFRRTCHRPRLELPTTRFLRFAGDRRRTNSLLLGENFPVDLPWTPVPAVFPGCRTQPENLVSPYW